ncbi:nucleotide-binding protein [Falsiroseomonas selenitidurans]|uniref:MinD/ParA family protein n=1 Tax=Falsiroseomonas selenitidurans TaxID=2716335 RepID=A0ABX1EB05_9PROT|nr:AAA family ATPase [Falsiroseomonas selenitidurans]NKC34003.1 MinD/ParA family protein [Falsiroseomonas selenitidurans]
MTARRGRIVAIASGKGGVGKTWLSITLAQALAQRQMAVLLVDGDFGLANVDVQLGLQPGCDLLGVLSGRTRFDEAVVRHEEGGFDVLPGRSGSGALADLPGPAVEAVGTLLHEATAKWDVVVLDLGAGLSPATRRLAAIADTLLVVATDEPTSLTDAYAVLKLYGRDRVDGDARIVVNQARDEATGRRTGVTLQRACQTFLMRDVPVAGILRRDDRVADAIRRQAPLLCRYPNSMAAMDAVALARQFAFTD